jgi:membrane-associated protease RseP (regulator of RpoE activity)
MRKEAALWSCAVVLILGSMALAGEQQRPYIGVKMDSGPLPELLTKHLRLDPGQGIRINNIMVGSPADEAGLERDDIIFELQGQKITSLEQFIGVTGKAGIGAPVTLEVIHLGQRQTVHSKLGPAPEKVQWKYPLEPDVITWRPGKIFKIGPDGQEWTEIPFDKIPDINVDLKNFFKESYTYHHATGGEDYTITIEGDPADNESRLIVEDKDGKHNATVDAIESLPEKYREATKQAVEDARKSKTSIRIEGFQLPESLGPEARRKLIEKIPKPDMDRLSEQKDLALEKLRGQMEQLQQRMKELEKLLPKNEAKKGTSSEAQTPAPSDTKQKSAN